MPESAPRIVRAWLTSLSTGIVEFERDWTGASAPSLSIGRAAPAIARVAPASILAAARGYGYTVDAAGNLTFIFPLEHGTDVNPDRDKLYVAGEFNGWQNGVGDPEWELQPGIVDGERVMLWTGDANAVGWPAAKPFKFVTGEHHWLTMPDDAQNVVLDGGSANRALVPGKTGRHLWRFTLDRPLDLAEPRSVGTGRDPGVPLIPGDFFYELKSDLPMGAIVERGQTTFRLFAPRARAVAVFVSPEAASDKAARSFPLARRSDADGSVGVWEVALDQNLDGWRYWYCVSGVADGPGRFDPAFRVLDPYALATVDGIGPGLVVDRSRIGKPDRSFRTPAWQDLVIVEAHVRDLVAHAPIVLAPDERLGFAGLAKWVESPDFYLHHLGVNCVELQPVQEFDNKTREEYHWGYMTNNYFSVESSYSRVPEKASGIAEFQQLVAAFHKRGMAVILDVVYNHVGEPAHLLFVDRLYYFWQDAQGKLANWSGCGNDLRAQSAMSRRLIVDSLVYLVETFGVDGFRVDLAELLGLDVLWEIEAALKKVKPDVILIAEPWSFRGHIAGALRDTGWASWNDGYRNFMRDYVRGNGPSERMEYFLRGSPWYFAKWPAQTVNYTESHDDSTWVDMITENANNDGSSPTVNDVRRSRLMAALLFMSVGIPMLSAGQDFLRSKRGVNNTYQRGDLNALDYRRLYRFLSTHAYFADWIALRRGGWGKLLRHYTRPADGFYQFIRGADGKSLAVCLNADGSRGAERLLFAVNPTTQDATLSVGPKLARLVWRQLADQDRFYTEHGHGAVQPVESELVLPGLACGLWACNVSR